MIHAIIKIREIDYETSFINLFPKVMEKWNQKEQKNLAVRFLQRMGDSSISIVLGTLSRMTERGKGELLSKLVNLYQQEFLTLLNRFLEKENLGNKIQIGSFCMGFNKREQLIISIRDVKADYNEILQNEKIQQKIRDFAGAKAAKIGGNSVFQQLAAGSVSIAAKFAVNLMPDETEKMAISVLERPENKSRILQLAEQAMEKNGLCVKLEDIRFKQVDAERENHMVVENRERPERSLENLGFSEELEEELLHAVTGYFKDIID